MKLTLYPISHFGRKDFTPKCEKSRLIAKIVRHVNLTEREVEVLKEIGFKIEILGEK